MKTQINLKIDNEVKLAAQAQARALGLSLSAVINATLSQFARTGELHVTTEPQVTPQLAVMLEEARADYLAGETSGPFDTVDDLMKHLQNAG